MTLLGNAVQLNKFSVAQCGRVGRKQDSRKAKGRTMKLFNRMRMEGIKIDKLVTAKFSGYEM